MRNITHGSALMLDGDNQSALAIVRSLGRNGLQVNVGGTTTRPIAGLSRFCSGVFLYPDPLSDPGGFQKAIVEHVQTHPYSLVIPVTDVTICPLMEIRKSVEERAALAMASNESLEVALSKSRTYDMAMALGIPIPRTFAVKEIKDLENLGPVWGKVSYPLVIKPDRSKVWVRDGRCRSLSVSYAFNPAEVRLKSSQLLTFGSVVVQEYVPGEGIGIGILASHGDVRVECQYRRLHEVPLTGGGSSYRVTEAIDPKLAEWIRMLMRRLRWHGVAMAEFKINHESGNAYLMEINGRFWGALALAVAAGADFPRYLFEQIVEGRSTFPESYRIGLRCRNLQKETMWVREAVVGRLGNKEAGTYPPMWKVIVDSLRLLNPRERFDTFEVLDPWPGIVDGYRIIHRLTQDVVGKLRLAREVGRMALLRQAPWPLLKRLRRAGKVLVVCSGNITRSPFAANLLSHGLGERSVTIMSAGLYACAGRPADSRAVIEARLRGLDLTCHRSSLITLEMVEEADVIFVMESWQLLMIRERFGKAYKKTYLLTCLSPGTAREIADPMIQDETAYAACFDHIHKALQPVIAALQARSSELP